MGGGLPYKEERGTRQKFLREVLKATKTPFCGGGLKEVQINLLSSFFGLIAYLKRTAKALVVDLRSAKIAFSNP